MNFGVLALQGDFREHIAALNELGISATEVRTVADLAPIDALIFPGGESTTISMLAQSTGLDQAITLKINEGMFSYGSCAGMILLASEILDGRSDQICFSAIDMAVRRNGFGRQVDSFEAEVATPLTENLMGVFIRAPKIEKLGPEVKVLGDVMIAGVKTPVMVRQGRNLATSFHPELDPDRTIHRYFVQMATGEIS